MDMCISLYRATDALTEGQEVVDFDEDCHKLLPWQECGVYRRVRRPNWIASFKRRGLEFSHYELRRQTAFAYEFERILSALRGEPLTVTLQWDQVPGNTALLEGDVIVSTIDELVLPVVKTNIRFAWVDVSGADFLDVNKPTWICDKGKMAELDKCMDDAANRSRYQSDVLRNWRDQSFARIALEDIPF